MLRYFQFVVFFLFLGQLCLAQNEPLVIAEVPIRGGLYEAQSNVLAKTIADTEADVLVLSVGVDVGGNYQDAMVVMSALREFEGKTVVWVDDSATGVVAMLALAADEIYSRKNIIIGDLSAEDDEGETYEMDATMQAKIRSELSDDIPLRMEVAKAMMDADFELLIGDELIKPAGEFLVLTGAEAAQQYTYENETVPLLIHTLIQSKDDLFSILAGGAEYALSKPNEDAKVKDEPKSETPKEPGQIERITEKTDGSKHSVYVVEISGVIDSPQMFILRRALKEAIANDIDTILIDMDTPGGALGTTLEMMEALQRFKGKTITYVNSEAISAGSYIASSTQDIYFSPDGIMGAAEAVTGSGQDIPESMNRKITSVMEAKIRSVSEDYRYREEVQIAMMNPDFRLEIDGEVISPKGELLTLTANEAIKEYGYPPHPLLAAGIAEDVNDLLDQKYGEGNYTVKDFKITWSEEFAKWFKMIAPLLMGLGLLMIYFEAQTPGFGVFGIVGVICLALFFSSNFVAGLAGYEAIILFTVGVVLIGVELFIFPGTLVAGIAGICLMLGSLIWAMVDVWPEDGFTVTWDMFERPIFELALGVIIAVVGGVVFARFVPRRYFWDRITLAGASATGEGSIRTGIGDGAGNAYPEAGAIGRSCTALHPIGEVEVDGRRYQAKARFGGLERGVTIRVTGRKDFYLIVEEAK